MHKVTHALSHIHGLTHTLTNTVTRTHTHPDTDTYTLVHTAKIRSFHIHSITPPQSVLSVTQAKKLRTRTHSGMQKNSYIHQDSFTNRLNCTDYVIHILTVIHKHTVVHSHSFTNQPHKHIHTQTATNAEPHNNSVRYIHTHSPISSATHIQSHMHS